MPTNQRCEATSQIGPEPCATAPANYKKYCAHMNTAVDHDLRYESLMAAAISTAKVGSLTHAFYRYPARFGEEFVREAILNFSSKGDSVLDPFCGGGTTLVEALANGRVALGSDLSELAVFVARVKTTPLSAAQLNAIEAWVIEASSFPDELVTWHSDAADTRLAGVPVMVGRLLANLRQRIALLPRGPSRDFATCLLLKTAQWALDGKEQLPTPVQILSRLRGAYQEMRTGMLDFTGQLRTDGIEKVELRRRTRLVVSAAGQLTPATFGLVAPSVSLVVTSPPYLGVHVLYNRWQLEGRRELHAPFFVADCRDIGFPSSYTIVPRNTKAVHKYFNVIASSFQSVRALLRHGAYVVQLVSFSDAETSLPLYLSAMGQAGLDPCETYLRSSIDLAWRSVPGRRWYARVGAVADSSAAQEVLLVHRKGGRNDAT